MILLMLVEGLSFATPVGLEVAVGRRLWPLAGEGLYFGRSVRVGASWSLGALELGPCGLASMTSVDHFGANDDPSPMAGDDFMLLGLGPRLSAPSLLQAHGLRLGAHFDALGELSWSPFDALYYQEDVVDDAFGGVEPQLAPIDWLFRPGIGLEMGRRLGRTTPAPELLLGLDAEYHTVLGGAVVVSIGLRSAGAEGR